MKNSDGKHLCGIEMDFIVIWVKNPMKFLQILNTCLVIILQLLLMIFRPKMKHTFIYKQ